MRGVARQAEVKAGKSDEFNAMYLDGLDKFSSQFKTASDKEFEGLD